MDTIQIKDKMFTVSIKEQGEVPRRTGTGDYPT